MMQVLGLNGARMITVLPKRCSLLLVLVCILAITRSAYSTESCSLQGILES